jgi:hypothetical protein
MEGDGFAMGLGISSIRWPKWVLAVLVVYLGVAPGAQARMKAMSDKKLADIKAQTLFSISNLPGSVSTYNYNVTDVEVNSKITIQNLKLSSASLGSAINASGPIVLGPSGSPLVMDGLRIQLAQDSSGNFLFLRVGTDDMSGEILTNANLTQLNYDGTLGGAYNNGPKSSLNTVYGTTTLNQVTSLTFPGYNAGNTPPYSSFYLSIAKLINNGVVNNTSSAVNTSDPSLRNIIPGAGWWLSFTKATATP